MIEILALALFCGSFYSIHNELRKLVKQYTNCGETFQQEQRDDFCTNEHRIPKGMGWGALALSELLQINAAIRVLL